MNIASRLLGRHWFAAACLCVLSLFAPESFSAGPGSDNAGLYTVGTFTNNANQGTGFGPWQFNMGAGAVADLTSSATNSGNINSTNGLSFRFYGGTNFTYAEAIRDFNAPLSVGDEFSVTIAYNFNGGNRGVNILNTSGDELLNINYGGSDTLSLQYSGSTAVVIRTDYVSTAAVQIVVQQLSGNQLDVTLTRNDGYTTNIVSTGLSAPAAKVKFYNGGHEGNTADYAMFVNDLVITPSSAKNLLLEGRDGMASGMINSITLSRTGPLDPVIVSLTSSNPSAATVPVSVSFNAGDAQTNFFITGAGLGRAAITASAAGYPDATLDVAVYDLGYDDASYYPPGIFEDVGNGGLGFQSWIIQENNGSGDGYTNYAGAFIGDSTSGGIYVNTGGSSFGLYANSEGSGGNPLVDATRGLGGNLQIGQAVSLEFGVNYRNGSKGVVFQNGSFSLFEVAVYSDDYFYKIGSEDPVSLGWSYASDSAIEVLLNRVAAEWYDVTIIRRGSAPETNMLGIVTLDEIPNQIRFFNFNTESGDENNLYFNRLAYFTSEEIPTLTITGNDGMVAGRSNTFVVTRTGPTNSALVVDLTSTNPGAATVAATVAIPIGTNAASFFVTAISNGHTHITADATGYIGDAFDLQVVDVAHDDTTYYPPAGFTNGGNGGHGFLPWILSDNSGEGDGYTNFAGVFTGSSLNSGCDTDASDGSSFILFANRAGTNGPDPLTEAVRPFAALEVGQSFSVDLGVNFRNGAKGLMFQSDSNWLFEVAVFGDDYWYNIRDAGDNPVSLGWTYAQDTVIGVTLSRTGANAYRVHLERSGSAPENLAIDAITLSQSPDRVRFYNFNTDGGIPQNNLYINRLALFTGVLESTFTDGIPNSWWDQYGIAQSNRVAGADLDSDGEPNRNEYIADTNPDNSASIFTNRIIGLSGSTVLNLQTGPTTNSRVYDVWWTTNLLDDALFWNRLGVTTPGNGGILTLIVTNDVPFRVYRTGVALP